MKPAPFGYARPARVDDAVAALARSGSVALAGGQTLVGLLNQRRVRPRTIVDLSAIGELCDVRRDGDDVVAGAMVTLEQASRDPLLTTGAPVLANAIGHVASAQVRARSTLGGSVAHADPVGEVLTALVALRASVTVASEAGERTLPVDGLTLAPGDLIVAIRIPVQEAAGAFDEVAPRYNARALVAAAAVGHRLVVAGVAARPVAVDPGRICALEAWPDPRADAAYRRSAATALAERVLAGARSRAAAQVARVAAGPTLPVATAWEDDEIGCTVNGDAVRATPPARLLLSDFLRHDLGLTATHVGCEHGVCGACNVLVDGVAVRSCLMLAVQVQAREVVTVEGLRDGGALDALADRFVEHHALQCGFCTPGFLVTLAEGGVKAIEASDLAGNVCRCTGYAAILEAARAAAS